MSKPTLLIMAGGTGGHIMPGIAIGTEMQNRGWRVVWLGHPERMEGDIVPKHGFELLEMRFAGLRGKGVLTILKLPFTLLSAILDAFKAFKQVQPDVVLGMGGYVSFPGGLVSKLKRIPLIIHEQNAVAGTANKWLSRIANKTITGFPGVLPAAVVLGNPVRQDLTALSPVSQRYNSRTGPLNILIIGGSLGASILNEVVPNAMAMLAEDKKPVIKHQAGKLHIEKLQQSYQSLGVNAETIDFIDDMSSALEWADLLICRAGAMTVAEVAAAGVAALFIPLPGAIDDHQNANARYLTECSGAWLQQQPDFNAKWLSNWLANINRKDLELVATHAQQHAMPDATRLIADACEHATRGKNEA